jgi:hypothetical protein
MINPMDDGRGISAPTTPEFEREIPDAEIVDFFHATVAKYGDKIGKKILRVATTAAEGDKCDSLRGIKGYNRHEFFRQIEVAVNALGAVPVKGE